MKKLSEAILVELKYRINLNQLKLVDISKRMGVSSNALSKILNGKVRTTVDRVSEICTAMDMDVIVVFYCARARVETNNFNERQAVVIEQEC